jgi:DNA-binding NarL/FixJ family response regulator
MITRVAVVEDQPRILEAQVALLADLPDLEVVGQASTGEWGLEVLRRTRPHVALVDLGLPGMDGVELTARAREAAPDVEVLVWTIFEDARRADAALAAGAAGYLLKGTPVERLAEAIHAVRAGGAVVTPSLARPLLARRQRWPASPVGPGPLDEAALSERERELLHLISRGLTNPEAAAALGLTAATVRTHLSNLFVKLDVTNRVEAVTEGIRRGLVEL